MWWKKKQQEAPAVVPPPRPVPVAVHLAGGKVVIVEGTTIQYPPSGLLLICMDEGKSAQAIFNVGQWVYVEIEPPKPKPTEAVATQEANAEVVTKKT